MPPVHAHAHHAITERFDDSGGESGRPARSERLLELGAVVLLALTTLATAWSGYQAARWSGEQSQSYARASTARIESQKQSTAAGQLRIDDLLVFDGWLEARVAGNRKLAAIYERRFRPALMPAFRAWLAQRPFVQPPAIPGPLYMPQYKQAQVAHAAALDAEADAHFKEGTDAKTNGDRYILSTVFFAAVLFFAGISLRVDWLRLRIAVLGMGCVMLLGGVGFVLSLP